MKKKIISILLGAAMAGSVLAVPVMAAEASFTDVSQDSWFYEAVNYTAERGLFSGTDSSHFSPDATMTRGMFVTVLGRMEDVQADGSAEQSGAAVENISFSDVKDDAYYAPYVSWAASNGIVTGMGDGTFAPNDKISREQMCTIFVRYLRDYKKQDLSEYTGQSPAFSDAADISSWAAAEVAIAQQMGLVEGSQSDGVIKFEPKSFVTRAAAATVFMRLDKSLFSGEQPDVPDIPNPDDTDKPGTSTDNPGGSGSGPDTDKPTKPDYSDEQIAEEAQVAGYLKNMTEKYETQVYVQTTDQIVQDAMKLLMACLNDALEYRDGGGFLSEKYVRSTYAAEMSEFESLYSQMTEEQEDQMKNVVIRLESEANVYVVLDYFGVARPNL